MAYKFKTIEKLVGTFIVIAFFLIIITVAMIFVMTANPFKPPKVYHAIFFNGTALKPGKAIQYNSITIGKLTKVELKLDKNHFYENHDDFIYVEFIIENEYTHYIRKGVVLKNNAPPLPIDLIPSYITLLDVPPSMEHPQLAPKDLVATTEYDPENFIARYHSDINLGSDNIQELIMNINSILADLANHNGPYYGIVANIEKLTYDIAYNEGSIGTFLNDNNVLFNKITGNLTQLEKALKESAGLMGSLKDNPIITGRAVDASQETTGINTSERYRGYK